MENVYKIIFYNLLEIANCIIAYAIIGYLFSFGKWSVQGIIGYSDYMYYNMDQAIFGLEFIQLMFTLIIYSNLNSKISGFASVLISSAEISTFLVGRVHLIGSIVTTFLYSAFFQSMLIHWIWNKNGWMYEFIFQGQKVHVKDHGGSLVMHLPSSVIGVVGN